MSVRFERELSDVTRPHDEQATRRRILKAGLAAVGGVVAAGAAQAAETAATPKPLKLADEKIAQAQVQYQTSPKDGQKCSLCVNWEAPNACKIVAGTIAPEGWCIAYAPKES